MVAEMKDSEYADMEGRLYLFSSIPRSIFKCLEKNKIKQGPAQLGGIAVESHLTPNLLSLNSLADREAFLPHGNYY